MTDYLNRATITYKLTNRDLTEKLSSIRNNCPLNLVLPESSGAKDLPLLKITKKNLFLEHQGHNLFFHPSMALLRLINILRGKKDRFLEATQIQAGDTLLDTTMGLASDALIAAWAAGAKGKIIALECSPLIFTLVREGLAGFRSLKPSAVKSREKEQAWRELIAIASGIETVYTDHLHYLKNMPDSSIDIVYFDPMFRDTVVESSSIKPLKNWSCSEPVGEEAIEQACRVARKRVVLKERCGSSEFKRLGFTVADGGKYSSVCFGSIDLRKTKEA